VVQALQDHTDTGLYLSGSGSALTHTGNERLTPHKFANSVGMRSVTKPKAVVCGPVGRSGHGRATFSATKIFLYYSLAMLDMLSVQFKYIIHAYCSDVDYCPFYSYIGLFHVSKPLNCWLLDGPTLQTP